MLVRDKSYKMVGSTRFERVTYGLGNHCSIQLSYDPFSVFLRG